MADIRSVNLSRDTLGAADLVGLATMFKK